MILLPPTIRSLLDLNGFGFLDVFPPSNLKSGLRKAKLKKETSEDAEKKARLLPWNFDEQNGSKLMPWTPWVSYGNYLENGHRNSDSGFSH